MTTWCLLLYIFVSLVIFDPVGGSSLIHTFHTTLTDGCPISVHYDTDHDEVQAVTVFSFVRGTHPMTYKTYDITESLKPSVISWLREGARDDAVEAGVVSTRS